MDNVNVFFIDAQKFLKNIDKKSLEFFLENNLFKSQKRCEQFCLGRFLVKFVLKNYYDISEPKIVVQNKKPCLEGNNSVSFSISHSNNIILAAFYKGAIGADIEFMKDRDFDRLFAYYNIEQDINSDKKEFFYNFWTKYESEIKLQKKAESSFSMHFMNDYMLSVSFSDSLNFSEIKNRLKIYEVVSPTDSIKPSELINLKLVIDSNKNENTVVAQEISTAQFDFR